MDKNTREQELVTALTEGNLAAFEVLLMHYERAIWNHLRRLTGNPDDASDLTQETFIKLYTKRNLIDPAGNFKNYLYRIATNTAYDFLRKRGRMAEVPIEDERLGETIPAELTYSTREEDILRHDLDQALARIAPPYRTILLLYYREGFAYEELSETLDLPLSTVKTHLRRAKLALRDHLQNYE